MLDKIITTPQGLIDAMPSLVGSHFQGEWAIYSTSMLSAALTNIAKLYPETREEAVEKIDSLIKITMSPELRQYDASSWGEDPLETLSGDKSHISYQDWTEPQMLEFAERLAALNEKWGYTLATCGEKIDLKQLGIVKNRCVDDELIIRLSFEDKALMDFLKVTIHPMPAADLFGNADPLPPDAIILPNGTYATHGDNRDKGQRQFCGCIKSKDIGEYNTCPHLCEYCYANTSKEAAQRSFRKHCDNPYSESILG